MRVFICYLIILLVLSRASLAISGDDLYLVEELGRVIRSQYASELDKPLTQEAKDKLDRFFASATFLNPDSQPKKRPRRSLNELKDGNVSTAF